MEVIFLGTGSSNGIPVITCKCDVCSSGNSKNKRLRSSISINYKNKRFQIDCGPDFRQQALKHSLDHIDLLLISHPHYDHVGGIDDMRAFCFLQDSIPTVMSKETLEILRICKPYIFKDPSITPSFVAKFSPVLLENKNGFFEASDTKIGYFTYAHSNMKVNGYIIGNLAYITDIRDYDDSIFEILKEAQYLIISAPKMETTKVHLGLNDVFKFCEKLKLKKVWITHIAHELEHEDTASKLPENFAIAYDGLKIRIEN